MIENKLKNIFYPIRNLIVTNPFLFNLIWKRKFPKQQELFFSEDTEIVIEGFPRCGNTYLVTAFRSLQKREFNIAHHLHAPAQIIQGVINHVPTILIIRKPIDAVVSAMIHRGSDLSPNAVLKSYIHFYTSLVRYKENTVVATFEQVIVDVSKIVERVNEKFFSNFSFDDKIDNEEVMKRIDRISKNHSLSDLQVSKPTKEKDQLKRKLMSESQDIFDSNLVNNANILYNSYLKSSES